MLQPVPLANKSLADYTHIVGRPLVEEVRELASGLAGRRVVHLSATAFGGGVSEILYTLVPLMRDAIRKAGGTDLGAIAERTKTPDAWATDFTRRLDSSSGTARDELLRTVDVAVMLPGAAAADAARAPAPTPARGTSRSLSWASIRASSVRSAALGSTPSSSRSRVRARWYAANASACRPER